MKIIIPEHGLIVSVPVNPGINDLNPIGFGLPNYLLHGGTGIGSQNFLKQRVCFKLAVYLTGKKNK